MIAVFGWYDRFDLYLHDRIVAFDVFIIISIQDTTRGFAAILTICDIKVEKISYHLLAWHSVHTWMSDTVISLQIVVYSLQLTNMEITQRSESDSTLLKAKAMRSSQLDSLEFEDSKHSGTTLSRLNTLRKNQLFCDVTLEVGSHEVHAHRAVLASSSKYFFELFSAEANKYYKLGNFEYESFKPLVDYAYTSR